MSNIQPRTIFVKFIPINGTENEVKTFFGVCGKVVSINLKSPKSDPTETSYKYGFVTYATQAEADRAVLELDGKQFRPGYPRNLFVVHSLMYESRKEQDYSKELEKNSSMASQEEYKKLKLRYQANAKKINEIYNKPEEDQEMEELLSRRHSLQMKQDEMKKINDTLKEEIKVLRLQVKVKKLEMENTKLKEAK